MSVPLSISETLALVKGALRAIDEPPRAPDPMVAADHAPHPALPRCQFCKDAIEGRAWKGRYKGEPTAAHAECWERFANKADEFERFARARAAAFTSALPIFAIRHDAAEFAGRVRHPRSRAAAERYEFEHGSVAFVGPSGCGKTTAAAAIALRLVDEAVTAFRVSMGRRSDLVDRVARAYWTTGAELCIARKHHRLGEGEAPEFDRAVSTPLLFLDEIGQEMSDDRWLLELLDARIVRGLPTITTSGLTATQLESRYGIGAYRRLIEPHGTCVDSFEGARPRLVSSRGD